MPSGHASHKGTSDKPNVNANGMHTAADKNLDPQAELPEEMTTDASRIEEAVIYPPSRQRPHQKDT